MCNIDLLLLDNYKSGVSIYYWLLVNSMFDNYVANGSVTFAVVGVVRLELAGRHRQHIDY